jgi:hypothetical protein
VFVKGEHRSTVHATPRRRRRPMPKWRPSSPTEMGEDFRLGTPLAQHLFDQVFLFSLPADRTRLQSVRPWSALGLAVVTFAQLVARAEIMTSRFRPGRKSRRKPTGRKAQSSDPPKAHCRPYRAIGIATASKSGSFFNVPPQLFIGWKSS